MNELTISKTDKLLIVAPHPDDESIGCGGLLAKYGSIIDVLLVTDGSKGAYLGETTEEIILKRKNEFTTALHLAGVANVYFLNIPDRETNKNFKKIKGFDLSRYTKVFVPNRNERHIDHNCLYGMFSRIISRKHLKVELYQYEVWSPIASPNYFVDIEDVMPLKLKMVGVYESQLPCYNYVDLANSLSLYRGAFTKRKYAEVFCFERKVCFLKKLFRLFRNIFNH